ncbi:MAG: macro domain-containing protein [Planctomycetes bacterium]|nr:macro domain-containing protein [Planctomycetota bacterium]
MLPPPRRFGALTVTLVAGDIAFRLVDAVVNAANDRMQMGGGVAGALRAAGGLAIQREADALAPAPLGAVVRTGAGDLLAQHVYHAVVIRYGHEGRALGRRDDRAT